MPSQIKVDEIKNVAGQYEIKTDTFKGQTTAGSINVQSEGTATTNLQQGLTKSWVTKLGNTSDTITIEDSFNVSTLTDTATGIFAVAFTNNKNNNVYAFSSAIRPPGNTTVIGTCEINTLDLITTAGYTGEAAYANSTNNRTDYDYPASVVTHGDLA